MVLKHGKLGIRSGNTFRHNGSKDTRSMGFIRKQLLNNERETVLNHGEYFDDGNLQATRSRELWLSLNKRKRWMLVDELKSVIDDENLAEEDYRVVLYERVLHGFISRFTTFGDCIGYHDSKLSDQDINCKHRYPRDKTYSYLTDLRLADQEKISNTKHEFKKLAAKKNFHNQHFRGLQRNLTVNHHPDNENNRHRRWGWPNPRTDMMNGVPDEREPNIPELRYEVCYPPDSFTKSLVYHSKHLKLRQSELSMLYPGTRAAMYGHHCYDTHKLKSLTKLKGRRDKPWANEYYRGACAKTIKECIEHRHEFSLNCGHYDIETCRGHYSFDDFVDLNEDTYQLTEDKDHVWKFNKTENYTIDLADLMKPKASRKRKRKLNKTTRNTDYCHPNVAMGTHSKFYGKGKIIYTERPENCTFASEESSDEEEINMNDIVNQEDISSFDRRDDLHVLEETYISCHIYSDSIKTTFQNGHCNKSIKLSQCKPSRYIVPLSGETNLPEQHETGCLLLWEKCSADSSQKEYRIRVQDNRFISTDIHRLLQNALDSRPNHIYTLNELVWMSENVINQLHSAAKMESLNNMKTHWSDFVTLENDLDLALRLSGSQIDVKTIQEVHSELVGEKGDKSSEDTITTYDVILVEELNFGIEEIPDFCDICVISFTDVAMEMTTLLPCQHAFCNQCWISYITERIRQGDDIIPCLGYSCEEVLDDAMIMSFVSSKMYENWKRRKHESLVEKSGKWKWCPNNSCGHLARTDTCSTGNIGNSLVQCKCDNSWCLDCQQPDHWPASCEQITVYRKMLEQNGDESGKKMAPTKTYFAHVKKCPNCNHPMEKNGGCSHMTCRCKHHFCWECLGDWNDHAVNGLNCIRGIQKEITMELDSDIFHPLPLKFYKSSVNHRYKWKSLGRGHIRRKVYQHESKRKAHHYKTKRTAELDVPNYFTPNRELIQYYIFIKQTHQILENMLIVMSNLTRKSRIKDIDLLVLQAEFCVSRQEQILEKKKLSEEDIERINKLNSSTWNCLRKLTFHIPRLHTLITKSKQKILGKPLSSFEMYK